MTAPPLLEVDGLHVRFPIRSGLMQRVTGAVHAVSGVSFAIPRGEAYGLVGESGCGKTTVARAVLQLIRPSAGTIRFDGEDLTAMSPARLAPFRRRVQAIFQDPFSSLNPRMTAGDILPSRSACIASCRRPARSPSVSGICWTCAGCRGVSSNSIPHEMSGGQRQRIGIARALAMEPDLIVCDEAVSALDVSVQAQIINLLADLRRELGLTYLFIGHDLSVVRHLCDQVAVMYLGRIMERASSEPLFATPAHPYTRALLDAVPIPIRNTRPDGRSNRCRARCRAPRHRRRAVSSIRAVLSPSPGANRTNPPSPPSGRGGKAACWLAEPKPRRDTSIKKQEVSQ